MTIERRDFALIFPIFPKRCRNFADFYRDFLAALTQTYVGFIWTLIWTVCHLTIVEVCMLTVVKIIFCLTARCYSLPSVLWRCWLGGRKGIQPVKAEWWGPGVVICLERGADLHTAQLMPLPLTVSCFSKIQIDFTFLVPAHLGSPGQRAVKRVCVCVCCSMLHMFSPVC